MRILFVAATVGEAFGQERVALDSARLLRNEGHSVEFLSERIVGAMPPGWAVSVLPALGDLHWLSRPALVRSRVRAGLDAVRSHSPDIVHFVDQFDYRFLDAVSSSFPSVFTSHTFSPTCPSATRATRPWGACREPSGWRCLWRHRSQGCMDFLADDLRRAHALENFLRRREALKRMAGAIAISEAVEATLLGDGWSRDTVHRVPNPVFPSVAGPRPRVDGEAPFLCASRLVAHKGVETAVRALALARLARNELWLCGEGPERERLAALARELAVGHRVRFLGRVPPDELRRIVRVAAALLQPNHGPEPFGLSVAEALAEGVPVVASRLPALDELVEHGKNGLLVSPADAGSLAAALESLAGDEETRERLGARAAESARRFSPEAHLEATLRAYRAAMNRFGRASFNSPERPSPPTREEESPATRHG